MTHKTPAWEKLYRQQCEEHEATYARMNEYLKRANYLCQQLVEEQKAHQATKDKIAKLIKELSL